MNALAVGIMLLQTWIAAPSPATYNEAYRIATEENRPMLVLVGAEWCPACVSMKRSTMPRMAQSGKLDEVVFTIVDTDRESKLASQLMRGSSIPQLILFWEAEDGWHRTQLTGAQDPGTVEALIARATPKSTPRASGVAGGN